MLIGSDWCWLMLIDARIRFNQVYFCQTVLPELLRSGTLHKWDEPSVPALHVQLCRTQKPVFICKGVSVYIICHIFQQLLLCCIFDCPELHWSSSNKELLAELKKLLSATMPYLFYTVPWRRGLNRANFLWKPRHQYVYASDTWYISVCKAVRGHFVPWHIVLGWESFLLPRCPLLSESLYVIQRFLKSSRIS